MVQLNSPKTFFCLSYIILSAALQSCSEPHLTVSDGIIPADRRIKWLPGVPGGIPDLPEGGNVRDFGARGDGITDDAPAFSQAIREIPTGTALIIPPGRYLLHKSLKIGRSVVLRGAGAAETELIFDLADRPESAIRVAAFDRGEFVPVTSGHTKGSTALHVADGSEFEDGGFAEIQQNNSVQRMYTRPDWQVDWATQAVGQMLQVKSVFGNQVEFEEPLNLDYDADLEPQLRAVKMVTGAGVEAMSLHRIDQGNGDIIEFANAAFSWVREVESRFASRSHVNLTTSYRCTVRDSYFHHAHDYGSGGHGYGVMCSRHTTGSLIENNRFSDLRHAMLLQLGANGNVYAFNHSTRPYADDGSWAPPDISLHGHYLHMNLFEGNVVQAIATDYWGPAGPGNTLFRNRIDPGGIQIRDFSHAQNIVGNQLYGEGLKLHQSVRLLLLYRNYLEGERIDPGSNRSPSLPASLYLDGKPAFFGDLDWPVFGGEAMAPDIAIPAQKNPKKE